MEAKKFPFVYMLLIIISAACLFLFISREAANAKSYVRFDGKYYYSVGAAVDPAFLGEEAGEIEHSAVRSIFNRNGDSNFFGKGAKIYRPLPEVAAVSGDIIYVENPIVIVKNDGSEENEIRYFLMRSK